MSKSTRSRRSGKLINPEKLCPDSPLFAHATKRKRLACTTAAGQYATPQPPYSLSAVIATQNGAAGVSFLRPM
jgi:hypothetical protein